MTPGKLIRPLSDMERKCTDKYRAQLLTAEAEVLRLRTLLGDMAIAFLGREAPVTMTEDGLYEPEAADGA